MAFMGTHTHEHIYPLHNTYTLLKVTLKVHSVRESMVLTNTFTVGLEVEHIYRNSPMVDMGSQQND